MFAIATAMQSHHNPSSCKFPPVPFLSSFNQTCAGPSTSHFFIGKYAPNARRFPTPDFNS